MTFFMVEVNKSTLSNKGDMTNRIEMLVPFVLNGGVEGKGRNKIKGKPFDVFEIPAVGREHRVKCNLISKVLSFPFLRAKERGPQ